MRRIGSFLILIFLLVREIYSQGNQIKLCLQERFKNYEENFKNAFSLLSYDISILQFTYIPVEEYTCSNIVQKNCDITMIEPDCYDENYNNIIDISTLIQEELNIRKNDPVDGEIYKELIRDLRADDDEGKIKVTTRALPLFMDYGILYYRKDIHDKPPKTYSGLNQIADELSIKDEDGRVDMLKHRILSNFYVGQFNKVNEFYYNLIENVLNTNETLNHDVIEKRTESTLKQFKQLFDNGMIGAINWSVNSEKSVINFISGQIMYMRNWSSYLNTIATTQQVGFEYGISNILYSEENENSGAVNKGIYLCIVKESKKITPDVQKNIPKFVEIIKTFTSKEFMKTLIKQDGFYDIPAYSSLISEDSTVDNVNYCNRINCSFFRDLQKNHIVAGYSVFYQSNFKRKFNNFYEKEVRSYLLSGNNEVKIETVMSKFSDYFQDKYVEFGSKTSITMIIVIAIEIAITSLVTFYIIKYRKIVEIRRSSPLFLIIMLFGIILSFASVLTFIGKPNNFICIIKPYIFVLAFGLTFYSLLLKTFRIKVIFDKVNIKVKDSNLVFYLCILLGIELILVTIWSIFAGMESRVKKVNDEIHYYACQNTNNIGKFIESFLIVINGIALIYGCYLAYKVKNVYSEYNESKVIGLSIYGIVICMVILMCIVKINSLDHLTLFIIESLMIILSANIILVFMFTPKLWKLHINNISDMPYEKQMYI